MEYDDDFSYILSVKFNQNPCAENAISTKSFSIESHLTTKHFICKEWQNIIEIVSSDDFQIRIKEL
jgi:hypothetical protein